MVVGLGGSATNDAGAGLLVSLGAPVLDATGRALPYGGAALQFAAGLGDTPRLRDVRLVAATDVDSPLTGIHGASAVYGPQKGATARTSCFRIRPPTPVPETVLRSTPRSAASRRTRGVT